MKTAIITVGKEVLTGKTINTNLSTISAKLNEIGIDVNRSFVIDDQKEEYIKILDFIDEDYNCNNIKQKMKRIKKKQDEKIIRANTNDAYAIIKLENGVIIKKEIYYGSGYLSSSGRYVQVPKSASTVEMYSYQGVKRTILF